MRRSFILLRLIFSVFSIFFLFCGTVIAADFVPYRAIYDIEMSDTTQRATLQSIGGQTRYQFNKDCGGWAVLEEYGLSFDFGVNQDSHFFARYQTWESFDGKSFSFKVLKNSTLNGEEHFEGFANKTAAGVEAHYVLGGDDLTLPSDTIFPTAYITDLLNKARGGTGGGTGGDTPFHPANLFMGGDSRDAHYFTHSVLGKKRRTENPEVFGDLAEDYYWPVTIAYYDPSSKQAEPEYQLLYHIQDNGVVQFYRVDYFDYQLTANLRSISRGADKDC